MTVDIYATTIRNTYLAVRSGFPVPAGWTAQSWKTLDLDPDKPRIGLDPKQVISDIERQGWSAIGAEVVVEVKVVG